MFSGMVDVIAGMGSGANYYLAVVLQFVLQAFTEPVPARDYFKDGVLAAGGLVSSRGRMSEAFNAGFVCRAL